MAGCRQFETTVCVARADQREARLLALGDESLGGVDHHELAIVQDAPGPSSASDSSIPAQDLSGVHLQRAHLDVG